MAKNGNFQTVIKPKSKWFDLRLKEVFKYRDLIGLFVRRDFVAGYKQTILGPLWAIIQPLLTSGIFTLVFGKIANLAPAGVPTFTFFYLATMLWQFFASTLKKSSATFIANSSILGKVYFPRLVMPLSSTLSNLVSFTIQFLLFVLLLLYSIIFESGVGINYYAFLLPLILLQTALLGLGVGMIICALTTKYRDLAMLVGFGTQLWMYASPVVYDMSVVPESIKAIYMLNPLTPVINNLRYGFLGLGNFDLKYTLISWAVTIVVLFIGLIAFNKAEKTFADTI